MAGVTMQYGRRHADDRFYDAAKARRSHRHHHKYHHPSNLQRTWSTASAPAAPENRPESEEPSKSAAPSSHLPAPAPATNLDRFLESTTPSVAAHYLSKTTMRGRRTWDEEERPYFSLGDLWESFKEWSAYGAGVPLVLNGSDGVVQYYVPYLSAIQLYGESDRPAASSRRLGEDSDADCSRDSSSDGSSDYELERGLQYSTDQCRNHVQSASIHRMDRLSSREKHVDLQEGFSSDYGEPGNSRGCLLFEYLERELPYSREPLADKVLNLARGFPGLRTLRSCDLSSSSWISVAWYPIYRIPTGPTLKDLDSCFLTFHYLSTPMTGAATSSGPTFTYPQRVDDDVPKISLRVFGLASYKFKGSTWTCNSGHERQLASSLLHDAGNWLRQRNVSHPDYQFFASHGVYR